MKTNIFLSHLSLFATAYGLAVSSDPCVSTEVLPTLTVTAIDGSGYSSCYTTVYNDFGPEASPHTYTITQSCSSVDCSEPAVETALPSGFTVVTVACSACASGQALTQTVTCPVESITAYSASGYTVISTTAAATQAVVSTASTPAVATVAATGASNGASSTAVTVPVSGASTVGTQSLLGFFGGFVALIAVHAF